MEPALGYFRNKLKWPSQVVLSETIRNELDEQNQNCNILLAESPAISVSNERTSKYLFDVILTNKEPLREIDTNTVWTPLGAGLMK